MRYKVAKYTKLTSTARRRLKYFVDTHLCSPTNRTFETYLTAAVSGLLKDVSKMNVRWLFSIGRRQAGIRVTGSIGSLTLPVEDGTMTGEYVCGTP